MELHVRRGKKRQGSHNHFLVSCRLQITEEEQRLLDEYGLLWRNFDVGAQKAWGRTTVCIADLRQEQIWAVADDLPKDFANISSTVHSKLRSYWSYAQEMENWGTEEKVVLAVN